MNLLIEEPDTVLPDTLTLSEIRRLAAERIGQASSLLIDQDGDDRRTALPFSVPTQGGDVALFFALAGSEAEAAVRLVEALHRGTVRSFARVGGAVCRIRPDYWQPRHEALERGIARGEGLFWGEDTVGQHPERRVQTEVLGATIVVREADALDWLENLDAATPAEPVRLTPDERDEEGRRVARLLDDERISKRIVENAHVVARWDKKKGPPVAVATIKSFMRGGSAGRPAQKKSKN